MKKQSGQMSLEMVLIMIVFAAAVLYISNTMRKGQYLQNLVQGPWSYLAGMIENGNWAPVSEARSNHPNQSQRFVSYKGDAVL